MDVGLLCWQILRLLMGKVVIGHAVHNDFKVLSYSHPAALTRDTSRIPLLNQKAGFAENECASLKRLTKAIFNRDIQVREISSVPVSLRYEILSRQQFQAEVFDSLSTFLCAFKSPGTVPSLLPRKDKSLNQTPSF